MLVLFKPHLLIHADFLWTIFENLPWLNFSIWKCIWIGNTNFSIGVWVQINYIKFVVYFEGEWLSAKLSCLFRLNKYIYTVCAFKFKEDILFSQNILAPLVQYWKLESSKLIPTLISLSHDHKMWSLCNDLCWVSLLGGQISFIISKHPTQTPARSHAVTCKIALFPGSWEDNTGMGRRWSIGHWEMLNWRLQR